MIEQAASDEPRRSVKRRGLKIFWGIIALVLAIGFPLIMIVAVLDSTNQQWVQCDVTGAKPVQGNRFNASPRIGAIETTDCGRITYRRGVTEENVGEIAVSFEPAECEFKLGLTSRWAADGWLPFVRPSAHDYMYAK